MKLRVTMDWPACPRLVGELDVFTTRGTEIYQFTYSDEWRAKDNYFLEYDHMKPDSTLLSIDSEATVFAIEIRLE